MKNVIVGAIAAALLVSSAATGSAQSQMAQMPGHIGGGGGPSNAGESDGGSCE